MKKIMHKLAIETPVVSILIVCILCASLYALSIFNTIITYVESENIIDYSKTTDKYEVILVVDSEYYEGIKKYNTAKWFTDSDSVSHEANIEDVKMKDNNCEVIVSIDENLLEDELEDIKDIEEKIYVKLGYTEVSVLAYLID